MVNSIKCSREVKKTETRYFLRAYGIDEVVMDTCTVASIGLLFRHLMSNAENFVAK